MFDTRLTSRPLSKSAALCWLARAAQGHPTLMQARWPPEKRDHMVNLEMVRSSGMNVQAFPMRSGDAGVEQTVRAMRRLIDQGKKDPTVHETAAHIIRSVNVPAFHWAGEVRAIYNWVLQNIRFTRDVYGKETLHAAPEILRLGIGDCDDFTILLCSLLGTIGHKTRIVTIAKPEDERHFSHVFPQVYLEGGWVTIDAARRNAAMGRNPEDVDRVRVWDTASDDFVDVQGLSGPAGAHPNALPGAYPAWVADPRFRNLRGHSIRGLGRYGAAEVRSALGHWQRNKRGGKGLGDIDWSAITDAITAGTTGAANIITATRANPYNLFPTTGVGQKQVPPYAGGPPIIPTPIGGISTNTLLFGGLGILAVALLAGGRR